MATRKHRNGSRREGEYAVDARLVMPETRFEVIDGHVRYVSPSDRAHGSRRSKLSALLEAYVAAGYDAACDMLTRTSEKGDMAPDGGVYPVALDPATGGRQLEELAFEVVSTESLAAAGRKAARLSERGVRRVFAIDVERERALEWSRKTAAWEILPRDGAITDRTLVLPLPLHDLVSSECTDDAVARALLAKQNPVLQAALGEARDEGSAQGKAEGKAEAILTVLAARGVEVSAAQASRVRAMRDEATLAKWITRAAICESAAAVFRAVKRARPRTNARSAHSRVRDSSSQRVRPRALLGALAVLCLAVTGCPEPPTPIDAADVQQAPDTAPRLRGAIRVVPLGVILVVCHCSYPDEGQQFRAILALSDGTERQLTDDEVSWTTGNTGVAVVDRTGFVRPVNGGVTELRASSTLQDVSPGSTALQVADGHCLCGIDLRPTSLTLLVGTQGRLDARGIGNDGLTYDVREFLWSTSNPAVATVSDAGVVTAVARGFASIIATVNRLQSAPSVVEVIDMTDAGTVDVSTDAASGGDR